MIQGYLRDLLLEQLQHYCKGIQPDDVNVSLWSGSLELRHLELNTTALQEQLDTERSPIQLTSGLIGKLTITIPWSAITTQSLVVRLDDVVLHASMQPATHPSSPAAPTPSQPSAPASSSSLLNQLLSNVQVVVHGAALLLDDDLGRVAELTLRYFETRPANEAWQPCVVPHGKLYCQYTPQGCRQG
jgi:hypothetical protein